MRTGVDYSWARPAPAAIAASGASFVVRYHSMDLRTSGGVAKILTRTEAGALSAAGLDIVSVWEGRAADRDPLKGYAQGRVEGDQALRQAASCGAPPGVVIYYAVDWDATETQLHTISEYFQGVTDAHGDPATIGVYGSYRVVKYLMSIGRAAYGWQTYAWSGGQWYEPAQLRQTLNDQRIEGQAVDLDEAHAARFGQWRLPVTYAPDDLLAVQRYCRAMTGQAWASLGITHQTPQGGGYHEGYDLLHAAGRAPEDPGSDYSYAESPRDRAGLTDAASGFDLGGGFPRFREITLGIVAACERGDPRTRDVREVIYTPDGEVVKRWDRLGKRAGGDDSHLSHTHISFFRDADGRRNDDGNFLGLLVELFEGEADLDAKQDASLKWTDGRVASTTDMTDTYVDPAGKPHPNQLVATLKRLESKVDAQANVTLTDEQVDRIAAAVIARPDNPLGDADKPAIKDALKQALREGSD